MQEAWPESEEEDRHKTKSRWTLKMVIITALGGTAFLITCIVCILLLTAKQGMLTIVHTFITIQYALCYIKM